MHAKITSVREHITIDTSELTALSGGGAVDVDGLEQVGATHAPSR
jgi:hypothetical protein